jgi:hypothetical protein
MGDMIALHAALFFITKVTYSLCVKRQASHSWFLSSGAPTDFAPTNRVRDFSRATVYGAKQPGTDLLEVVKRGQSIRPVTQRRTHHGSPKRFTGDHHDLPEVKG